VGEGQGEEGEGEIAGPSSSPVATKKAKKTETLSPKPTEAELDLLSHSENGCHLETDSLGRNSALRRQKDKEVLPPVDTNARTVKALEQRGLIRPDKGVVHLPSRGI
jgi:hypothetical protein